VEGPGSATLIGRTELGDLYKKYDRPTLVDGFTVTDMIIHKKDGGISYFNDDGLEGTGTAEMIDRHLNGRVDKYFNKPVEVDGFTAVRVLSANSSGTIKIYVMTDSTTVAIDTEAQTIIRTDSSGKLLSRIPLDPQLPKQ
jgi:hypothetical protein